MVLFIFIYIICIVLFEFIPICHTDIIYAITYLIDEKSKTKYIVKINLDYDVVPTYWFCFG